MFSFISIIAIVLIIRLNYFYHMKSYATVLYCCILCLFMSCKQTHAHRLKFNIMLNAYSDLQIILNMLYLCHLYTIFI